MWLQKQRCWPHWCCSAGWLSVQLQPGSGPGPAGSTTAAVGLGSTKQIQRRMDRETDGAHRSNRERKQKEMQEMTKYPQICTDSNCCLLNYKHFQSCNTTTQGMTLRPQNSLKLCLVTESETISFTSLINYLMLNSFCLAQNVTSDLNIFILLNSRI